jgi:S-adenosylmethionine-diacylgycerolhomoserine-N-methlytransferase
MSASDELIAVEEADRMSMFPFELGHNHSPAVDATHPMNRKYRQQRHIYDATRRNYLLGRDRMITGPGLTSGANLLEIGCGTGGNLLQAARLCPDAHFFGVDASTEMLAPAVSRAGSSGRVKVAHGDARTTNPQKLFSTPAFDHVQRPFRGCAQCGVLALAVLANPMARQP